ncbi:conserved hypothetical protein [Ricinus communis]|uniref:Uncharacterized protein n=1 Tax=Ricinus communis TaxID=3988 RepID=B9T2J3_RICCO|nr:conserved hypothetical protein [Ricinus communis]
MEDAKKSWGVNGHLWKYYSYNLKPSLECFEALLGFEAILEKDLIGLFVLLISALISKKQASII